MGCAHLGFKLVAHCQLHGQTAPPPLSGFARHPEGLSHPKKDVAGSGTFQPVLLEAGLGAFGSNGSFLGWSLGRRRQRGRSHFKPRLKRQLVFPVLLLIASPMSRNNFGPLCALLSQRRHFGWQGGGKWGCERHRRASSDARFEKKPLFFGKPIGSSVGLERGRKAFKENAFLYPTE